MLNHDSISQIKAQFSTFTHAELATYLQEACADARSRHQDAITERVELLAAELCGRAFRFQPPMTRGAFRLSIVILAAGYLATQWLQLALIYG